jgi:hypothetical protein
MKSGISSFILNLIQYRIRCIGVMLLLSVPTMRTEAGFSYYAESKQAKDSLSDKHFCLFTKQALERSEEMLTRLQQSPKRDSATIDSVVRLTRTAHDSALACGRNLSAMMLLATSEAARKLPTAENVLMFRMNVRDTRLFLAEARKYWDNGR